MKKTSAKKSPAKKAAKKTTAKKAATTKSPAKKATKKSATKKSATTKSATTKSPAKKATKKSATTKSATTKSATKKSAAKKSSAKKATKKTAAKKTAKAAPAKKTAAKKSPAKKATKAAPAKKTAAKKSPAKNSPAAESTQPPAAESTQTPATETEQPSSIVLETPELGTRVAPGDRFIVELGDNDAIDFYTFTVTRFDDDGLALAWQMQGVGDHGDLVYTRRALDDAARLTLMSQGSTMYADPSDSDARVDGSMPPFLVSRAFLRDLQAGSATCTFPASNEEHTFDLDERLTRTIKFGGAELTLPVLIASSDSAQLEVVDDPTFPLVLRRAEWGDDNVLFHEHQK